MLLTESSTVIKSNGNPDVEIFSETSLCRQNTHEEGMSRDTRDTNLVSDNETENTAKGKTSEHISGFSVTDSAREKCSRKWRLEVDSKSEVSDKEYDEYGDFKRFRAAPKYDDFKWDLSENLAEKTNDHFNKSTPEKDLQESILVENPFPLNLHPSRKID